VEIRGDDLEPVSQGEHGEVYVRGEQVSGEYLGKAHGEGDAWFATKDAGYLDTDGYLFIDGRLDDVIVRGGENMSPGEIEEVLRLHPSVDDVAVVGVPDTEWGEQVAAVIVLKAGATMTSADAHEWVKSRLRSTRAPGLVEFRTELPYNETGKLLRRVLRTEIAAQR
jgi:acyl-CoA synthetase (AMP-forming)/AMP-acid ligase II